MFPPIVLLFSEVECQHTEGRRAHLSTNKRVLFGMLSLHLSGQRANSTALPLPQCCCFCKSFVAQKRGVRGIRFEDMTFAEDIKVRNIFTLKYVFVFFVLFLQKTSLARTTQLV